jgi:hypothetical protein
MAPATRPPPTISPEDQPEMTEEISNKEYKNILADFDQFLCQIWEDGKRDWSFYSKEQFRRFWDRHIAEPRTK